MNEHGSFCLRCNNENDTDQVRREARPWCIRYSQDRAVNKSIQFISFLGGNVNIITPEFHFYSKPFKGIWNNAQHIDAAVLDGDLGLCHRCQSDKASDLNHIGKKCMVGTTKLVNSLDRQQVRPDATDLSTHAIQHEAKLLKI